jgi:N-acetylglucosamine malate deacetylase 1
MRSGQIESALVVAAHADDEALGCGGTIASLAARGARVSVAFIADGVGSRDRDSASAELQARRDAALRANRALGSHIVHHGDLPDNQLDTVPLLQIAKLVESLITRERPQLVLTHHAGDLNIDHRRVHQAVVTACRPQPSHPVRGLGFFEVPSSTEWQTPDSGAAFLPNWYVDVTQSLAAKRQALVEYAAEMRDWPHARSYEAVEHLARWRGASVGVEAAEAFVVGRWIDRA